MKATPVIFVFSLVILLVACGKDKFETKPRLEIKDYSSREIERGEELRIRKNYIDKERDLNQAPISGELMRQNILPLGSGSPNLVDTFIVLLPDFPSKDKGEISFQLDYSRLKESVIEPDTFLLRFAVTDRAGNKSDTIISDQVVIKM